MKKDDKALILRPGQEKLIERASQIRLDDVFSRDEMGFSTRIFVQCNLPHSDPGDDLRVWTRSNGNAHLSIKPGEYFKDGKMVCVGYPYGNIPRLLLFYVCSQTIRTKNRYILLDRTLSAFMRNVGIEVTGGRHGTVYRFKEQIIRLFSSSVSFFYDTEQWRGFKTGNMASEMRLWWDVRDPNQANLFDSHILLTEEFYNEIMLNPVPLDMGIVCAIKQSPLALDLYTWLTHRIISVTKPTKITWKLLALQLGSDYTDLDNFVRYAKEALRKIYVLWPELKIEEFRGGIMLKPGTPSVPMKILTLPSSDKK